MNDIQHIDTRDTADKSFVGIMARVRLMIRSGEIPYPTDGQLQGDPCPTCGAAPRLRLRAGMKAPVVADVPNGAERETEYYRILSHYLITEEPHDDALHRQGAKHGQRALELEPPRRTFGYEDGE